MPFLKLIRCPALQSLSIHDFGMCPDSDTPVARSIYAGTSALHSNPLHALISAILDAVPLPPALETLSLRGLYLPPEESADILEQFFANGSSAVFAKWTLSLIIWSSV